MHDRAPALVRHLPRRLALVALLAMLGACENAALLAAAGSTTSLTMTRKLPPDHLASVMLGAECSVVTLEEHGYYCKPRRADVLDAQPPLYCYRTLGVPDCYAEPDPYDSRVQPIVVPGSEWPAHRRPVPRLPDS